MDEYKGVWIFAEQQGGSVQSVSYELLARARALADKRNVSCTAVVLGIVTDNDLDQLIKRGADQIITVEKPQLDYFLPEPYSAVMEYLVKKYKPEIIIAGATATGRTLMPLLSVKCHAGLTADCTELDIEKDTGILLQTRPAIGGNIMATIKCTNYRPQMATVRPKSIRPAPIDESRTGKIIRENVDEKLLKSRVKKIKFEPVDETGTTIQQADTVVSGGRGLKQAKNFELIHELAHLLNAAVGASRDAVDRGWISYPHQIGLSGKTISPKLYLCAGVSGSIQHLAGIKTAENIIAINSDKEAQIFQFADFGVVGDLFEVIPVLIEKLKQRKQNC